MDTTRSETPRAPRAPSLPNPEQGRRGPGSIWPRPAKEQTMGKHEGGNNEGKGTNQGNDGKSGIKHGSKGGK